MNTQNALMLVCPATGIELPYPSQADQYRAYHGTVAWLFNPWTMSNRDARDIGSDPFGHAIVSPGGKPLKQDMEACDTAKCAPQPVTDAIARTRADVHVLDGEARINIWLTDPRFKSSDMPDDAARIGAALLKKTFVND
jgi:hypothetical protein